MVIDIPNKIFFYCCPLRSVDKQSFHHGIVCLAEGLSELGFECYGNRPYWKMSPDSGEYLIKFDPDISPDDCAVAIIEMEWFMQGYEFPENFFHESRTYKTAYFELHEQSFVSFEDPFREFDYIFRGFYNHKMKYYDNMHPWVFGLSNRILKELETVSSFHSRQKKILVNFRHSAYMQSTRSMAERDFLPKIDFLLPLDRSHDSLHAEPTNAYHQLQWLQTGKRHYPSYYQRLRESASCACFGGFFVPAIPRDQTHVLSRFAKKLIARLGLKTDTVLQWDSWRFWETLAAGCVAFHIDLDKYGCVLPVMPENWKHYIGVDFDNIQSTLDRLDDEPAMLATIARAGREWSIQHYAPVPTALRFLDTVFPNHKQAWSSLRKAYTHQLNQQGLMI